MKSYKDFYIKTIESQSSFSGLKLVLGGTGLGKTYGLLETINEYVNNQPNEKYKFIYLTNRHNLITQQEKDLKARYNISTTYLKSNRDIILNLHKNHGLPTVINKLEKLKYFNYDDELRSQFVRSTKLEKLINSIERKCEIINDNSQFEIHETIDKELNFDCSELFSIFKRQAQLIYKENKVLHELLLNEPIIWEIFPYVEFEKNPECNVLLVTIHKVLSGFFNGKTDLKLASVEDKIIFLDEFDFLESDILKILCDEPTIINPLEFVTIFYQNFKHWSQADFWKKSKELTTVKEKFSDVIKYIEESSDDYNINLLSVIDFRLSDNIHSSKPNVLFQTNQMVTPNPFFLTEENNSWVIHNKLPENPINPRILFNILTISTNKIVGVFNYFRHNTNLVNEIIQKIWNQKNDNQAGVYEKYIKENMLYHRTKSLERTDSSKYKEKSPYDIGYRLIKLLKRTNTFDPNSAELSQVELFATPESLIAKLADSNIVFALSATTDLPRTLRCFNLEWLKEHSNYIELNEEDYLLIRRLRDTKANTRKTSVNFCLAQSLSVDSTLQKGLEALWKVDFFEDGNSHDFRLQRLSKTLNTIKKSINSDKFSHLVFLTTFKEIRKFLKLETSGYSAVIDLKEHNFEAKQFIDNTNKFFNVKWDNRSCNLIFLSAEDAKKLEESKNALDNYKKAFSADKVIVITQYNSASNGVNLPCYDEWGNETDFRGLHLLEENHFWFDDSESDISKFKNIEKQAFWYLWKLWDSRQIDKPSFKISLNKRAPDNTYKPHIKAFNKLYKDTPEKILNAISLYHQAIGRIERKRERILEVDITLDEGVFMEFHKYLTSEDFQDLIHSRDENITSALILEIQRKVIDHARLLKLKAVFSKPKSIKSDNERSREMINRFLAIIEQLKDNKYTNDTAFKIKEDWNKIREVVLKHAYSERIELVSISETLDVERDFCFETKYISNKKEIIFDIKGQKIFSEQPLTKVQKWNLDFVYRIISDNEIIKNYFNRNDYKTGFEFNTIGYKSCFTPYIYQAILQGAIGEKAIEALLLHNGIELEENTSLPNELFEVVDAKVSGASIYFDFKNYGETTLDKFNLPKDDLNYEYDFDSANFINKVLAKYKLISSFDSKAILYIVNLYSESYRNPDYFDSSGKRIKDFSKSSICVLPSIITQGNFNSTNTDFHNLLQVIQNQYETA